MEPKAHEGWITFAAILAGLAGVANLLFGLGGVFRASVFPTNSVLFSTLTYWGWGMIIFGILEILAAVLLVGRSNGGRILAIVLASVSIVGWMLWLGAFPFAGLTALVLDVLVIYGLSVTKEYFAVSTAAETTVRPSGGMPAGSH